jgi:PAS domain S-box-containing protein
MTQELEALPYPQEDAELGILDELPVAYVEMNAHGVIVRANRLSHSLHPSHAGDLIGKHAWDLMPSDEQQLSRAAFFQALESTQELPVARRPILTTSGEFRTYELHRSVIRDGADRAVGMRVVSVDVTESHRAQEEAQREHAWLQSVLASLQDAVIVTDALGFVRTVNAAAEHLFGFLPGEMLGEAFEDVLPLVSYLSETTTKYCHSLVLDQPSKGIAGILDRRHNVVNVEICTAPILEKSSGFTSGVVALLHKVEVL